MASLGSYSFLVSQLLAFAAVVMLALMLRWTFRRGRSLVASVPRTGEPGDYGLLEPVASPASLPEAELIRARLVGQGIRATVASTTQGPRVMVFATEARTARALLKGPR